MAVTTICSRPPLVSSRPTLPRILTVPRPVVKYSLIPPRPHDDAAGGKIRPFDVLHQSFDGDGRIVDLGADAVDDFAQIVRGHVGGHADRDAGAAVDQQIRKGRRENRRLRQALVIIRDEIDRVLVHVLHQRGAQMRHARLGITHGGGRIAFHRAEIALAVHQRLAHGPRLRHVDQRRIDHRLAVRMKVAAGVAADFGALVVLAARIKIEPLHGEEDAPLRRFQPVPHVGQRAGDDDRHRVIQERILDFVGDVDLLDFFVGGKKRACCRPATDHPARRACSGLFRPTWDREERARRPDCGRSARCPR